MSNQVKERFTRRSPLVLSFGFLCLLFLCPATTAQADEIAIWNFNDSDLIVDRGAGLLTTNFNLANVVFSAIVISFATQGTSTGFNSNQFQYSLDGIAFVDFVSPYTPAAAFGTVPLV